MTRNRDETRQRILDAVLDLVAEEGFAALGVNAVARRAGADKQLIYRYFGGLDGLMAAAGAEVAERMATALATAPVAAATYAGLIEGLAAALLRHLMQDRLYRQLRLMEASAPSPATEAFQKARGAALAAWLADRRGSLTPPAALDAAAINAVIIAAVEGIAILGPAGMPAEEAETRLLPVLQSMLRTAYA
ncbi:MAG: TetR/AcrR family transcriptional regulator [Rhodobacterales bacterium]|nr:MAG: TetR/AcrR family transcriptional regulator [Rhodobacterales bacterium]